MLMNIISSNLKFACLPQNFWKGESTFSTVHGHIMVELINWLPVCIVHYIILV